MLNAQARAHKAAAELFCHHLDANATNMTRWIQQAQDVQDLDDRLASLEAILFLITLALLVYLIYDRYWGQLGLTHRALAGRERAIKGKRPANPVLPNPLN